jgi:hypothetical protein
MAVKAALLLWIVCIGLTLRFWSVTWYAEKIQICRPAAEPNKLICADLTYPAAMKRIAANWLKQDPNELSDAFWPDGRVNLKDFNELSKRWKTK